jgi:hypothetical protein
MALLQNIALAAQNPINLSGAAGSNERSQFGLRLQTWQNKYMANGDLGFDEDTPIPPGEVHPYAWFWSIAAPTLVGITASPQSAIGLVIEIYPTSVTLGVLPATSADTTLGKIDIEAISPRIVFEAISPRITFEGDE